MQHLPEEDFNIAVKMIEMNSGNSEINSLPFLIENWNK